MTALYVVLAIAGILITVYVAIWSKYGIGQKLDKGFGKMATSISTIDSSIDKRMVDLITIIKLLLKKQTGTVTYQLKNIGSIKISVIDMNDKEISYNITAEKEIFAIDFIVEKLNVDREFHEKERELFGENVPGLFSPIPTVLRVRLPSSDKEKSSEYMALLLEWLDTEYFENIKELKEAESNIGNYLKRDSMAVIYRSKHGSDAWHWCIDCSNWPTSDYVESAGKPTSGGLCNECRSKENLGTCTHK